MESYIPISFLNDFIFCPRSIYFHQLYGNIRTELYHQTPQVAGKAAHASIEEKRYSTRQNVLQGTEIYCAQYNLCGKIDLFDCDTGKLTERKKEIKAIYDGYVFQVYAQYFALTEMGYTVKSIVFYDLTHNKTYPVKLPAEDAEMLSRFESIVQQLASFDLNDRSFVANPNKCAQCIYHNLCDYSVC